MTFTFSAAAPDSARQDVLEEIRHWHGIVSVQLLKPGARNPDIARMAYAVLADDADIDGVAEQLGRLEIVESASVPARRFLAPRTP